MSKDWGRKLKSVLPRIVHVRPSQAVSSHLSNGCHLAFPVSPVNSFPDHHTSINGSDETRLPCGSRRISDSGPGATVFYKDAQQVLRGLHKLIHNSSFFIISS